MQKQEINTLNAPQAIGPYSQAIKCGNLIFCSGQIPINPQSGEIVSDNIEKQTHQVMQNIGAILQASGVSFNNIIKTTIFVKDINDFNIVNEIYSSYLQPPYPARSTVEVRRLPKDVKIEIECIAVS